MNKTWIKEHWLEILLCVGIVIQIGALAVFNLTRLPYESNYDSSCAYAQIVEMWRQKRILLKDWAIRPLWVLFASSFRSIVLWYYEECIYGIWTCKYCDRDRLCIPVL